MSERVLEQHEIDHLVEGIREGSIPTGPGSLTELREAQPIDLSDPSWSQDRLLRRRLPVLDLVFGRLGPLLQVTLTKSLRFPIRAECTGTQMMKFADFRSRFEGKPCLFQVMRMDPLRGYSIVILDCTILYALIDALMGGLGVGEFPMDREVSDIEASLLHKAHADLLRDLENAWRPWFPLRVEQVRADRSVHMLSTLPDQEVCHVATVMVAGDVLPASPIFFVMPYTSLEPLFDATSARAGEELDPNWRMNLEQNLRETDAVLSATLGEAELSAERVHSLAPGDIVELERAVGEDIDVHVEGSPVFQARLGKSNLSYGVSISNRLASIHSLVDRSFGQTLVRKGVISREQLAVALVDESINRRPLIDSLVERGWGERPALEAALRG